MHIEQKNWLVSELVSEKENINLNPTWQRGAAWKPPRQVLLIDSILRGMDIPKIYLRKLPGGRSYDYDAVDGQQRLRALWEFRSNQMVLDHPESLGKIDGLEVSGKSFLDLDQSLKDRFDNFLVSVAEIKKASNDEITDLFARLQMGISLNPAELRNAMAGPLRHAIDVVGKSHAFFVESRIPDSRYKRQDFAAHIFAMAIYRGEKDIKAPNLKSMVADHVDSDPSVILRYVQMVHDALDVLAKVNELLKFKLVQKWLIVDLSWMIMQWHSSGYTVDPDALAEQFEEFERLRRDYVGRPEDLLQHRSDSALLNRRLYEYIVAFKAQGALSANLKARNRSLNAYCQ